jgi:hypothetical protein
VEEERGGREDRGSGDVRTGTTRETGKGEWEGGRGKVKGGRGK